MIEYLGNIGLRSLTDGHLGRHLEYFKTLNDQLDSSSTMHQQQETTKKKNFKIKFQVILVFYWTSICEQVLPDLI